MRHEPIFLGELFKVIFTYTVVIVLVAGFVFMTGCSKDPGEQRKAPGSFLRPGGDVVIGQ